MHNIFKSRKVFTFRTNRFNSRWTLIGVGLVAGFLSPIAYAASEPSADGQPNDLTSRVSRFFTYYFPMTTTRIGVMTNGEENKEHLDPERRNLYDAMQFQRDIDRAYRDDDGDFDPAPLAQYKPPPPLGPDGLPLPDPNAPPDDDELLDEPAPRPTHIQRPDRSALPPDDRLVWPHPYPPGQDPELLEYVRMLSRAGVRSLHPWYPSDRRPLETYGKVWKSKAFTRLWKKKILPAKPTAPYAKKVTLVIDANCFYNRGSTVRRPGTDLFLADAFEDFEIVLIGSPMRRSSKKYEILDWNPAIAVDPSNELITYTVPLERYPMYPYFMLNSLRILGRDPKLSIIVTPYPENVIDNPNNCVVLNEWDETNPKDTSLATLMKFLKLVGWQIAEGTPADWLIPEFHSCDKDIVEFWDTELHGSFFEEYFGWKLPGLDDD